MHIEKNTKTLRSTAETNDNIFSHSPISLQLGREKAAGKGQFTKCHNILMKYEVGSSVEFRYNEAIRYKPHKILF